MSLYCPATREEVIRLGELLKELDEPVVVRDFECLYCGRPSAVDPSDQSTPADYCHESDHEYLGE